MNKGTIIRREVEKVKSTKKNLLKVSTRVVTVSRSEPTFLKVYKTEKSLTDLNVTNTEYNLLLELGYLMDKDNTLIITEKDKDIIRYKMGNISENRLSVLLSSLVNKGLIFRLKHHKNDTKIINGFMINPIYLSKVSYNEVCMIADYISSCLLEPSLEGYIVLPKYKPNSNKMYLELNHKE